MRLLIADDEKMARRRLRRLLEALGEEIVRECKDGEEALAALDPGAIDGALLDIDMPGATGLELARIARERGVPVIFVTAHEGHAVEAFQTEAVHFLLKPIDAARLAEAIARLRERARAAPRAAPARLGLRVGDDVVLVDRPTITHALYDGALVTVHVWEDGQARAHLSDHSLSDLEALLGGDPFLRVHRRALLNLDHVQRLVAQPSGGYVAQLRGGGEAPVSRAAARELRRRFP